MPLTTLIAYLTYDSGDQYRVGLEDSADRVRVYWEEEDDDGDPYWQCFTTFSALDDDGNRQSDDDIIDQANRLIVAHQRESEGSLTRVSS